MDKSSYINAALLFMDANENGWVEDVVRSGWSDIDDVNFNSSEVALLSKLELVVGAINLNKAWAEIAILMESTNF